MCKKDTIWLQFVNTIFITQPIYDVTNSGECQRLQETFTECDKCDINIVGVYCGQIGAVNFQELCFVILHLLTVSKHVT